MEYALATDKILAAAYGEGSYACAEYNEGCETEAVSAPDTGFFAQPAQVLYPTLFGIAIVLGVVSYSISRVVKRMRSTRNR